MAVGSSSQLSFVGGLVVATLAWLSVYYGMDLQSAQEVKLAGPLHSPALHSLFPTREACPLCASCAPPLPPPASPSTCPRCPAPAPVAAASSCPAVPSAVAPPPPSSCPVAPSCPALPPAASLSASAVAPSPSACPLAPSPSICPLAPSPAACPLCVPSPAAAPPQSAVAQRRSLLKQLTGTCDPQYPYSEALINGPVNSTNGPEDASLPLCSPEELQDALRTATHRPLLDGPLYVGRCRLQWYTPAEACDLVERAGFLVVAGDSLTRNVAQALLGILSGDYRTANQLHLTAPEREDCACEHQFWDRTHHCRLSSSVYWKNLTRVDEPGKATLQGLICPLWNRDHFAYFDAYGFVSADTLVKYVRHGGKDGTFGFFGGGMHHPFGTEPKYSVHWTYRQIGQAAAVLREEGARLRIIPNLMSKPGPNKFPDFKEAQGNKAARLFNDVQRRYFTDHGWLGFESYLLSHNSPMADGVHVWARPNYAIGQLLLNHLDAMLRDEARGKSWDMFDIAPSPAPGPAPEGPVPAAVSTSPTVRPTPTISRTPAYANPDVHGYTDWNSRINAPNAHLPRWYHRWYADMTTYKLEMPSWEPQPAPVAWPPPPMPEK